MLLMLQDRPLGITLSRLSQDRMGLGLGNIMLQSVQCTLYENQKPLWNFVRKEYQTTWALSTMLTKFQTIFQIIFICFTYTLCIFIYHSGHQYWYDTCLNKLKDKAQWHVMSYVSLAIGLTFITIKIKIPLFLFKFLLDYLRTSWVMDICFPLSEFMIRSWSYDLSIWS